ncbi:MAG: ribosome small subunit-dependent GTPase A [Alloprevotella sp.]|nr:ribosome small subunit-dependent GTPase A [Alloprevotella sp.]
MWGLVVRSTGSWYDVLTDDGERVPCKVKGNFRLRGIRSTNPVAVGDCVHIVRDGTSAFITEIEERRNFIVRRASNLSKQSHILAANVDACLLVATLRRPETSTTFMDRCLASAEAYRVAAAIAFNKTDLLNPAERQEQAALAEMYRRIGYEVFEISALDAATLSPLREYLRGKRTLIAGNSGVGKSTLLNALIPTANVRTAEISEAHQTGMHTTTFSELFPLPEGGSLIDIPGIKGFGTFNMAREEIAHYFPEIFHTSRECRFDNCTHTHEPGCAVQHALECGQIAASRYASYLSMLEDEEEGKYRTPL